MRVHERGVGETRSCGTGICAAVVARAAADGAAADGSTWRVDVPGGSCSVRWRTDGELELTGPAVLVAEIDGRQRMARRERESSGRSRVTMDMTLTMTTASATGGYDLEERQALRRVAGLSTELADVTEVEYRQLRLERVVLVGVWTTRHAGRGGELAGRAGPAGRDRRLAGLDALIQRRDRPDPATYIGSGKAKELRDIVNGHGADTVICDGELTPGQLRQLEEVVKVKVVDRTALILDIFAQHARSKEGKAQVELAQLQYLLPRLRGWGESLSRQVGGRAAGGLGIGGRGPGETKIEIDRRRINSRMAQAAPRARRHEDRPRRQAGAPTRAAGAQRCARRLHQRRQVLAAQPAHRRRRAGGERAVRDARPDRAPQPRRPTVGHTRWPTRSASSGTCRRNWSRRSARRWRRSATPT